MLFSGGNSLQKANLTVGQYLCQIIGYEAQLSNYVGMRFPDYFLCRIALSSGPHLPGNLLHIVPKQVSSPGELTGIDWLDGNLVPKAGFLCTSQAALKICLLSAREDREDWRCSYPRGTVSAHVGKC